jgi:rare lipoprotein A
MNQRRFTYLSTVVITAFLAPMATVCSKSLPALAAGSIGNYRQESPRSLPIITPLTVTELETDEAIPSASNITPQPDPTAIASNWHDDRAVTTVKSPNLAQSVSTAPAFDPNFQNTAPVVAGSNHNDSFNAEAQRVSTLPQRNPGSDANFQNTAPVVAGSNHNDSFNAEAQRVSTLPQRNPAIVTPVVNSGSIGTLPSEIPPVVVKIRAVSPSVLVMRSDGVDLRAIINSSTIEAEIVTQPEVAPAMSSQENNEADLPSFTASVPTYTFDSDRPQQVLGKSSAQTDDGAEFSQASITIPVERVDRSVKPERLITYRSNDSRTQSAFDRIVATQTGKASWYGAESGPKTANGERFNPNGLTAAHRTLPFGTKVRVTSIRTGKAVTIRINDRGPFHSSRILDLSAGAAEAIGIKQDGVATIRMEVLGNSK